MQLAEFGPRFSGSEEIEGAELEVLQEKRDLEALAVWVIEDLGALGCCRTVREVCCLSGGEIVKVGEWGGLKFIF